jgi:hypothetical protein
MNMSTSDSDRDHDSDDHLSIAEIMRRKNDKTMVPINDDRARIVEINAPTRNGQNNKMPAVVLGLRAPAESSDAPMQIAEKHRPVENLQKQAATGRCAGSLVNKVIGL